MSFYRQLADFRHQRLHEAPSEESSIKLWFLSHNVSEYSVLKLIFDHEITKVHPLRSEYQREHRNVFGVIDR